MQFPLIHSNGTSAQTLNAEYKIAIRAVQAAIDALDAVTVHDRDYYPLGAGAAYRASSEHHARRQKLIAVKVELEDIWQNIVDQS